jgi:hypothetical protein
MPQNHAEKQKNSALMTDLPIHYAKMAGNINVTRRGSGPDCTELYERGRKQ